MFFLYDYDSSAILADSTKLWSATNILAAYNKLYGTLKDHGIKPLLYRLDNECSTELNDFFHKNTFYFQLVTPNDHRRNTTEREIGIFKDHFITGLAYLDPPPPPIHWWWRPGPQVVQNLNLLRESWINPQLSFEEQLNGTFDFNKNPLSPPGTKVLIHERPAQRKTWAPHVIEGFYVGGALDH